MKKHFFSVRPFAIVLFLLAGSSFFLSGCNKKLTAYNADFEGLWRTLAVVTDSTSNTTIQSEILIDGKDGIFNISCASVCGERLCDCAAQQSGRAVISQDHLRIKIGSGSAFSASLDKEPSQNSATGEWTMIIDGQTYYRQ